MTDHCKECKIAASVPGLSRKVARLEKRCTEIDAQLRDLKETHRLHADFIARELTRLYDLAVANQAMLGRVVVLLEGKGEKNGT